MEEQSRVIDSNENVEGTSHVVEQKKVEAADQRSFWTMVLLSIQNAFNDKAAQTMLIALGTFLVNMKFQATNSASMSMESLGVESAKASAWVSESFALLILAPFIFLAPVAGWISDRYSKTYVLRAGAIMQAFVLGLIYWAIMKENFNIAIVGFGLLALQSTILSPAKKGVVKEMLGSEKLGFASGVLELSSVLAICVGQIVSGFWFNNRLAENDSAWFSANWPILLLFLCSIPALFVSFSLKVYPSPSKRPFKINILWEHVGQMKDLLGDSKIRLSALGIGFFWFMGGFINIVAFQVANTLTSGTGGGMGKELAYLLTSASGGMIIGGALASYGCRRSIELGLVPIGGIIMTIGSIALASSPIESVWFKVFIAVAGCGAAIFLVPLNAYLQDHCDEEKRGKVIAGSNFLDCLTGGLAVGIFIGLSALDVPISVQFIFLAILCACVTVYATGILPQHFVRFTVLTVVRIFYKQKVLHAERIPREGGVLIVPNHITYIDAFILTGASTRPIRFLITDEYFKKPGLTRLFLKMFDTVPISEKRAKDAIQKAADAVTEGGVVCIFPEGQLTRTGAINELKRGYEMIARKAKCQVLPVYMDGLWGSIFSYERGKYFKKMPYRLAYGVTVSWGELIDAKAAKPERIRKELLALGMDAFKERAQLENPNRSLKRAKVKVLAGDKQEWLDALSEVQDLTEAEKYDLIYNGLQLTESHAIHRGETVAIRLDDLANAKFSLGVLFPVLSKLKLILISESTSSEELAEWNSKYRIASYIGGDRLKDQLNAAKVKAREFYHVDGSESDAGNYPILVEDSLVIALSMPHPETGKKTDQYQSGWKDSSYGRLLPGFSTKENGLDSQQYRIFIANRNEALASISMDNEGYVLRG